MRCVSCRGTARCAPTPGPAPFCSSGIRVERASNQVIRFERRLPTFELGLKPRPSPLVRDSGYVCGLAFGRLDGRMHPRGTKVWA